MTLGQIAVYYGLFVVIPLMLLVGGIDIALHVWSDRRKQRAIPHDYDATAELAELNPIEREG
jgi:hypothetical protein